MNTDPLKLENQLCFPLYVCAKEIVRRYKPFLDELDLTYTQYITMLVLWEAKELSAKELGKKLYLDSGTLTPVLKKLEQKQYLTRCRDAQDERNLRIALTPQGEALKAQALSVPKQMCACMGLAPEDQTRLKESLDALMTALGLG